jgi:hypothetical protein
MESQTLLIKNQGVQIILNRMQSHPEEFVETKNNRWAWVIEKVLVRVEDKHETKDHHRLPLPFLSNDEVDALYDKYMSIQGEAFTHRVMRELLEDDPSSVLEANNVRFAATRAKAALASAMIFMTETFPCRR